MVLCWKCTLVQGMLRNIAKPGLEVGNPRPVLFAWAIRGYFSRFYIRYININKCVKPAWEICHNGLLQKHSGMCPAYFDPLWSHLFNRQSVLKIGFEIFFKINLEEINIETSVKNKISNQTMDTLYLVDLRTMYEYTIFITPLEEDGSLGLGSVTQKFYGPRRPKPPLYFKAKYVWTYYWYKILTSI